MITAALYRDLYRWSSLKRDYSRMITAALYRGDYRGSLKRRVIEDDHRGPLGASIVGLLIPPIVGPRSAALPSPLYPASLLCCRWSNNNNRGL